MLLKIKSSYIIKIISKNILQKKLLPLFNHSKNIQKKLSLSIEDFKEFFNQIILELYPKKDYSINNGTHMFINRNNETALYKIYFNNNEKEEIKRNFLNEYDKDIFKIKVVINNNYDKSLKGLFKSCECLQRIDFIKFNRTDIINMGEMFSGCISLENIFFNNIDTRNVISMNDMFNACENLLSLDLSKFKTNNVTNMASMFSWCKKLKKLDLSNFELDHIKGMNDMFFECTSLENVKLNTLIINKKINFLDMFSGCNNLEKIIIGNIRGINTENVFNKMNISLKKTKVVVIGFKYEKKIKIFNDKKKNYNDELSDEETNITSEKNCIPYNLNDYHFL
jgi:surface protein